jgi:hypothetical protein
MTKHTYTDPAYLTEDVAEGYARALWVTAWADDEERQGRTYPGQELSAVAPPTPTGLVTYARAYGLPSFAALLPEINRLGLTEASEAHALGWYLGMEALGHGVAYSDSHDPHHLTVDSVEILVEDGEIAYLGS